MSETPDSIDKLLREQDAYIADDGFTGRVMAGLPRSRRWLPRLILLVAVVAGTAMAICWMPWKELPPFDFTRVFSDDAKVLSAWIPFLAVGIVLSSAVFALFRREN